MPKHSDITDIANLHIIGVVSASDPGAVGSGKVWVDTTLGTGQWRVKVRNNADNGWEVLTGANGGLLSSDLTFDENVVVAYDPALSASGKYCGTAVAGTAGATLTFADLVYLDPTDSRWEKTDANAAAAADGDARGLLGMVVLAAANDGSATKLMLQGMIRSNAFPTLTVGAPVYVSETAGAVVVAQPTTTDAVIRCIGFAVTADSLYFSPEGGFITHA